MKALSTHDFFLTSVSLRARSVSRIRAARRLLTRFGLKFSESHILEMLLKSYLERWRGLGGKSHSLRRYNRNGMTYMRRSFYVNRVLHTIATQRAQHSGESLSRMLDFAARFYLGRLVEEILSSDFRVDDAVREKWKSRFVLRKAAPVVFITYKTRTETNKLASLTWHQNIETVHKARLSPMEILHFQRCAA